MWSSGQVLIHFHGVPGLVLIALFAAGAVAGFAALQLVVGGAGPAAGGQFAAGAHRVRATLIQAAAIGLSVAAVGLAGWLLPPGLCWPLGGMATVLGYVGVTGVEYALQSRGDGMS